MSKNMNMLNNRDAEIVAELSAMKPIEMLRDPRIADLSDAGLELLFSAWIKRTGSRLRERDERSSAVLDALQKSGFQWLGQDHIDRLIKLSELAKKDETQRKRYSEELLLALTYIAATVEIND